MAAISVRSVLEGLEYSPFPHVIIADGGEVLGQTTACESFFGERISIQEWIPSESLSLDQITRQVSERAAFFFHSAATSKKISLEGRDVTILGFSQGISSKGEVTEAKRLLLDNLNIFTHLLYFSIEKESSSPRGIRSVLRHAVEKYVFYQRAKIGILEEKPSFFCIRRSLQEIIAAKQKLCGSDWKIELIIPEEMGKIFLDRKKIEFIFKELLENGIKYNDSGLIWITLFLQGNLFEFCVENTGRSFPLGVLECFRKQEWNPFLERLEGGGIGLLVCARLMGLMEGRIDIFNREEGGVVIKCSLPLQVSTSLRSSVSAPDCNLRKKQVSVFSSRCALVVDDNPVNAGIMKALLKKLGGSCECVLSGQEAV
ncbi:MAG: hypothetical protein HYZ48_03430, partial [Chlamydiales bacterium]|nr:hypothetical protein [Chlamydiales bacterium]